MTDHRNLGIWLSVLFNFHKWVNRRVSFEYFECQKHLDVLISIQNDESERIITTSVYSKPTNVHQYIMPNSSTSKSSLQGIAKGVATRIRRLCSGEADFQDKSKLYKKRLVDRGYIEAFLQKFH